MRDHHGDQGKFSNLNPTKSDKPLSRSNRLSQVEIWNFKLAEIRIGQEVSQKQGGLSLGRAIQQSYESKQGTLLTNSLNKFARPVLRQTASEIAREW